jgi:hypothetical protein
MSKPQPAGRIIGHTQRLTQATTHEKKVRFMIIPFPLRLAAFSN